MKSPRVALTASLTYRPHRPRPLLQPIPSRHISTTPHHYIPKSKPHALLPSSPARTRFAPSPTGYLHLGSLRTALFNYLLARKTGGQFILRIEDTDRKRTVPDAEARLCADLQWAGISWDEGPGVGGPHAPYRQSERTHLYRAAADTLLSTGRAYRCFCAPERLASLAAQRAALGLPTDYDRTCATLSSSESDARAQHSPYVVRLLAPERYPEFHDLVYGRVGRDASRDNAGIVMKHGEIAYEDPILLKSDGLPTYHLANVVDDHAMAITHVVRATEWMSSTPKHLELYRAFGWTAPTFAHVGLLVDAQGQKLSKRMMATDVGHYRGLGVLPEAMANFVVLMGWAHSRKSDVMDINDMVEEFRTRFTKGNATVNPDKLWFLQKAHVERLSKLPSLAAFASGLPLPEPLPDSLTTLLNNLTQTFATIYPPNTPTTPLDPTLTSARIEPYLARLLITDGRNYTDAAQFLARCKPFLETPPLPLARDSSLQALADLHAFYTNVLEAHSTFTPRQDFRAETEQHAATLRDFVRDTFATPRDAASEGDRARQREFYHALRNALVGGAHGPSMGEALAVLGARGAGRIQRYLDHHSEPQS